MSRTILFIGLGAMGAPMSANLIAVGHHVVLCDVREEHARALADQRGVPWVPLAQAGTVAAGTVILMLPDSPAVEAVVGGPLKALPAGTLVIDMSSSQPTSTVGLSVDAATRGITLIDAPVSGGVARAVTGELTIMVGAAPEAFAQARNVLAALGTDLTLVGPVGAGHAMKALNNLLSAIGLVGASEVLAIGAKFGLEPKVMLDVLNASTGGNHATRVKMERFVLSRAFDSGFSLQLMIKDLRTALGLAGETGTPAPVSALTLHEWVAAGDALGPAADHTQIASYVEGQSGIELRQPNPTQAHPQPRPDPAPAGPLTADSTPEDAQMTSQDEIQEYIDSMARSRGYVLDYHKVMAKHDYEVLQAANQMVNAAYLKQRSLDRRTKELIFITSLTVMRATKSHIQSHIKVALDLGVTPLEILEAIEIALPEAGVVAFQHGVEAWAETVGADGIEPRIDAVNGSGS